MKLLFHCCCAPCATACVESLYGEGLDPELFWYNPNIHPYIEYKNRREALVQFAAAKNLRLEIIDEYGLRFFIRTVFHEMENLSQGRCGLCYRIRLEKTASFAAERGFGSFSTSLLVSPYQSHEAVRAAGEEVAAKYGVQFLYRDFRPLFRGGQDQARSLGLYMQKYCGCIFSEEERYLKQ
jgi:predicted adenine nucleotide alpha hydrolase (AANH) superfamily ATPase